MGRTLASYVPDNLLLDFTRASSQIGPSHTTMDLLLDPLLPFSETVDVII